MAFKDGSAADAAEEVSDAKALDVVARFGFAVLGLVHVLIGIIALQIAFGGSGEADPTGALEHLASGTAGPWVMWAGAAGCLGLALWQLSEATLRARHLGVRERLSKTVSSGSLSVVYGSMAWSFGRFALGGDGDSGESTRDFTRALTQSEFGFPAILVVGGTVLGIGIYFVVKGVRRRFRPELRHFADTRRGTAVDTLGVAGHVAKGIALMLVGMLFVIAAATNNPEQSTGLDGSLKALQDHPFGAVVLVSIALGLICYGIFAMVRATFGRM